MTVIHIDLRAADETPLVGTVAFAPTRRLHIEEADDFLVLPEPFAVELVDGQAEVDLRPTSASWAWAILERVPKGIRRYVLVPDSLTPLDYGDLVDVDPGSLTVGAPDPTWWAALDGKVGSDGSVLNVITLTEAQYAALSPKVATTLYVIV